MNAHSTKDVRSTTLAVLRQFWPESGGQTGHADALRAQEACADALLARVLPEVGKR